MLKKLYIDTCNVMHNWSVYISVHILMVIIVITLM